MTNHALVAPSIQALTNPFLFQNHEVFTAIRPDGTAMFCAKHVCDCLEIIWQGAGKTLVNIPKEWKGVGKLPTPGGDQEAIFISEPAVYRLAFRSNKPAAVEFCNWVCEEVLPAIRRFGAYGKLDLGQRIRLSERFEKLVIRISESKDAFVRAALIPELRDIGNSIGRKIPNLEWTGKDYRQVDLFEAGEV